MHKSDMKCFKNYENVTNMSSLEKTFKHNCLVQRVMQVLEFYKIL